MEILNVGPLELIFIVLLALIILGPERMITSARQVGKWINHLIKSPLWASIVETSQEIQDLPKKILEESGIEEGWKEVEQNTMQISQDLKEVTEEIAERSHIDLQENSDAEMILNNQKDPPNNSIENRQGDLLSDSEDNKGS